jgi:hypothetical protein
VPFETSTDEFHGSAGFRELLLAHHGRPVRPAPNPGHRPAAQSLAWHHKEVFQGPARYLEPDPQSGRRAARSGCLWPREGDAVTEAEWLACDNADRLFEFVSSTPSTLSRGARWLGLAGASSSVASGRQMRLYACACCRQIPLLSGRAAALQEVLDVVESYADGRAGATDLKTADNDVTGAVKGILDAAGANDLGALIISPDRGELTMLARAAMAVSSAVNGPRAARVFALLAGVACESATLRCVFGNPFRPPTRLPPEVLGWNDGTVRRIAEGIYGERAFARLPILADALLDAGSEDEDVIEHCRSAGTHVRGCWVVDLILGRS